MDNASGIWHIWVDTGGTFTDCLAQSPTGRMLRAKVLSSGRLRATVSVGLTQDRLSISCSTPLPANFLLGAKIIESTTGIIVGEILHHDSDSGDCQLQHTSDLPLNKGDLLELDFGLEAPILAARIITETSPDLSLPKAEFHLATTKSTNALLERNGDRTAFVVTKGFKDLLRIGDQRRPDLFALNIHQSPPLHDDVYEIDERMDARGQVLKPLDVETFRQLSDELTQVGFTTVAIAFLHSAQNPEHENKAKDILRSKGIKYISCSAELAPFAKVLPRAETSVVNAYLTPLMERYLDGVETELKGGAFRIMTSAGGFVSRRDYCAKDSLFSGPAGGVVGASTVANQCGVARTIAFDMGGTSTDVARFDHGFDYQFEQRISGVRLLSPSLRIETVAAGGGSICGYGADGFYVGPYSAGASPGPASYGAGGPLTITDVNLLLGRMDPKLFGIPSNIEAARQVANCVYQSIPNQRITQLNLEAMLQGLLDIANERMADTIRGISVREGYDPKEYALTAFGGAGGQHACRIAEILGIQSILFPADAGLLSAFGLRYARMERFAEREILDLWDALESKFDRLVKVIELEAVQALRDECFEKDEILVDRRIIQVRIKGQECSESIDWAPDDNLAALFRSRYQNVYGYYPADKSIEIVTIRVIAATGKISLDKETFSVQEKAQATREIRSWIRSAWETIPVFKRRDLGAGDIIEGPALVQDAFSTMCIDCGWNAIVGNMGTLRLERMRETVDLIKSETGLDASSMQFELFTQRFFSLVEEMGFMLERVSISTNVKERLDFSCALLDAEGELIVNAPHIPVHLGAIGLCVRKLLEAFPMEEGDMVVTNHPAFGGSHLPDVTVVSPVFDPSGEMLGYVANRAHHAEIGGIRPGSMPPDARNLGEEGVVIQPTFLYRQGKACFEALENVLTQSAHPSRNPKDNLADLQAQAAANRKGIQALVELAKSYGALTVKKHMSALKDHAARLLSERLSVFDLGDYTAEESLDDGTPLKVSIHHSNNGLRFDFTGTGSQHGGNLNATPAIVNSVILYVLRLLVSDSIPMNEGLLKSVKVILPECMLNPSFSVDPKLCPPVVGGNVETSQRLVDLLLKALRLAGCSQGTMNNVIFGNDSVSYYETVCGGVGATEESAGAHATHSHMTNTSITDPEILEMRYPVRLHRFEIRKGSGGKGLKRGGNGIVREFEFLKPVSLSLLTQHRVEGPYGMDGGHSGKPGRQQWVQVGGKTEELASVCGLEILPGERLILETPGGGGYGTPKQAD
jgi:5-oxoprolinase (ATP-hydrolysing)